jgi:hypothetical protein
MTDKRESWWERVASLATIIQAVAVLVSLWIIWGQLQQQTDLAKANNVRELASFSSVLDLELARNEEMANLWLNGLNNREGQSLAKDEHAADFRYGRLLSSFLIFYENMYSQHRKGLLDETIYTAWEADLASFVEENLWQTHWRKVRDLYTLDFRNHVDALIESKKSAPVR